MLKIAKWNKKKVSLEQRDDIRKILTTIEQDSRHQNTETKLNVLNMFKSNNLKNMLIMLLNWVTVNIGAYTLVLNTTKLNGDIFLNFILSTLVGDLPSSFVLMITMKLFGRKFNLFGMQAMLGICCLRMAFLSKNVSFLLLKQKTTNYIFSEKKTF